jgi:hypothetical protein
MNVVAKTMKTVGKGILVRRFSSFTFLLNRVRWNTHALLRDRGRPFLFERSRLIRSSSNQTG